MTSLEKALMDWRVTPNFRFKELVATTHEDLAYANAVDAMFYLDNLLKTARLAEDVRAVVGVPLSITSGFRGRRLNEKVGGSENSQHCYGAAIDFNAKGLETRDGQIEVVKKILATEIKFNQLLLERGCIHIALPVGSVAKMEVAEYDVATKSKKPIPELA